MAVLGKRRICRSRRVLRHFRLSHHRHAGERSGSCMGVAYESYAKAPPGRAKFAACRLVSHSVREIAYGASDKADSVRRIVLALRELWAGLVKQGIQVVAIRDTPTMPFNVPECLSKDDECAVDRTAAISDADPIVIAAREERSVALLDFTDAICGAHTCAPVVGNVLVWRDNEHLTATYATSLDGALGTALDEVQRRRATLFGQEQTSALTIRSRWSQGPSALPIDIDKPASLR